MNKKNYILLLSCIFLAGHLFAQGKEDFNKRLFEIRLKYLAINNEQNLSIKTIDDAEIFLGHATDNGAELTGYFKEDTLVKIIEWIGLSNRVLQTEYFFGDGKLFFVCSKESNYAFSTDSIDYSKLNTVFTGRYYYQNGKLFDTILNDKKRERSKIQDSALFILNSKKYTKLLTVKTL